MHPLAPGQRAAVQPPAVDPSLLVPRTVAVSRCGITMGRTVDQEVHAAFVEFRAKEDDKVKLAPYFMYCCLRERERERVYKKPKKKQD